MDLPATIPLTLVEEAVVQTAITPLPELYAPRDDGEAPPVLGTRYLPPHEAETLRGEAHHDIFSRGYRLALWGDPCPYPTLVGAHGEVRITLLGTETMDIPLHVYLALQLVPQEGEGDMRIRGDLLPLATLIVAVEDELLVQHLLEQNGADAGIAVGGRGSDDHGRRLIDLGLYGLLEPALYQHKGVVGQILTPEAQGGILPAYIL